VHCLTTCLLATGIALTLAGPGSVLAQNKPADNTGGRKSPRPWASSRACKPDSITMAAESGGEITAQLLASTKILHVPPGEKDLKNATVLQAQTCIPAIACWFAGRHRRMGTRLPRWR